MNKNKYLKIPHSVLESLCKGIGDIPQGLSGTDINRYLEENGFTNTTPEITKWKRLFNAFYNAQNKDGNSSRILKFIQTAIHPSRFLKFEENYFENIIIPINESLSFLGISYTVKGKFREEVTSAQSISEAKSRSDSLYQKLKLRGIHDAVYKYCTPELMENNYFHAVFETTKGVADRIRYLAMSSKDGGLLINEVFQSKPPILIINYYTSTTDISEHNGFANLLIGFFGMFRNTTAHSPKVIWEMNELDAIEIMTIASLCHRKLDTAHKIR